MSQPIYDEANIFARIIRGEIPCNKVDECKHTLTFHDISPRAPIHVLVIPKGPYVSLEHFADAASAEEQIAYFAAISRVAKMLNVSEDGYRLTSNTGHNGFQEVFHLHIHLMAGEHLGPVRLPKQP